MGEEGGGLKFNLCVCVCLSITRYELEERRGGEIETIVCVCVCCVRSVVCVCTHEHGKFAW